MSSRVFVRAACAGVLAYCSFASAHVLPAPGSFGIEVVGERVIGGNDLLTVLSDVNPSIALGSTQLSGTIDTTHNSGVWQTPVARGLVPIFDANSSPFPVIAVPVAGANGSIAIDFVNFRPFIITTPPPPFPTTPSTVALGFGNIPYDVLVVGSSVFVFADQPGGANAIVWQVVVPTGLNPTPILVDAFLCSGRSSPYSSRMLVDPISGELVVPLLNSIDTFPLGTLGFPTAATNSFALPSLGATPYQTGTNIASGVVGPNGENLIVGLRQPNGNLGHGFVMFNAGVGAGAPFSANNPFGLRVLAPGFHEIAVSQGQNAPVATFLSDSLPLSCVNPAAGAVGQVTLSATGQLVVVVTSCPSPFGDPEARRNPTGDPVMFMTRCLAVPEPTPQPAQDSLCAIGTGAVTTGGILNPLGSLAVAGLPGFVVPTQCDRPISLPLIGAQHETVVSLGVPPAVGTALGQLTSGPAFVGLTPPATISIFGIVPGSAGATSLGNTMIGGLLGAQPLHVQAYQDTNATGVAGLLTLGTPLGLPTILPQSVLGFMSVIPPGGLVLTPPNPAAPSPALAVRSGFNFIGGPTQPVLVHPQHLVVGGAFIGSFVAVENPLVPPPFSTISYGTFNPIVTEIYSF